MKTREQLMLDAAADMIKKRVSEAAPSEHRIQLPNMPSPVLKFAAPAVHVSPPVVNVEAPVIHNESPIITIDTEPIAAAIRGFSALMESQTKLIERLVEAMEKPQAAPVVNVQASEIPAPIVNVKMPKLTKSTAKFKRDKNQELSESTTEHTYGD